MDGVFGQVGAFCGKRLYAHRKIFKVGDIAATPLSGSVADRR